MVFGTTLLGLLLGIYLRKHSEVLREPFGVLQAALLGLVGLILAFGLTLAVGRYEARRAAVVDDANAIGTTYLRAQMLSEPVRSRSISLLAHYTDTSLLLSQAIPGSPAQRRVVAAENVQQRRLWRLAGQALNSAPLATGPRLYIDSLNNMIDMQTVRVSALNNRVPGAVLGLEVIGAAVSLGLLALYLAILGRGRDDRPDRGRPAHAAPAHHLRPRPPDARAHPRPDRAARVAPWRRWRCRRPQPALRAPRAGSRRPSRTCSRSG